MNSVRYENLFIPSDMNWKSLDKTNISFDLNKDPHGWIQFKGTEICMDVHCSCGELTHIDGMFVYFIKCSACGQVYELNGHIELIPRTTEDVINEGFEVKETDI